MRSTNPCSFIPVVVFPTYIGDVFSENVKSHDPLELSIAILPGSKLAVSLSTTLMGEVIRNVFFSLMVLTPTVDPGPHIHHKVDMDLRTVVKCPNPVAVNRGPIHRTSMLRFNFVDYRRCRSRRSSRSSKQSLDFVKRDCGARSFSLAAHLGSD